MKGEDRKRLTAALCRHVAAITDDLRGQMQGEGAVRARAQRLHTEEQVGEDFEVWTDLLARRGAVLWVLKSVYVRVLEDRGLLAPGRILDPEAQQLFEHLAPNLGETAFLRWVYRDLASPAGGLPELFSPQPAEVTAPADVHSRELLAFWRHRDPDTGACWSFAEERFEGELMGDLYQELDPVVQERFALCQTPDFVRAFMLDRTLTPAIEAFGADQVRLLDPACGSGHFLIDGFKRLVAATADKHPDWSPKQRVTHCLDRVVGIDLNDYACALARARLIMTAADLAGVGSLAGAAQFHPHVYWADGLEQVEQGLDARGQQLDLLDPGKDEAPRASLTRPEVRAALRKVLEPGFHAVVANPPYITEKDKARKTYHREKVGRTRRYVSAYREYSLASPFTERCFQLAHKGGFVGLITSNNFMKREFGKPLIEKVLAKRDLSLVVDTSQAYIPDHGTPTVLLFACNRRPGSEAVRAVMGKRGETGMPEDPARGRVWCSIVEGWRQVGFENEYISVADPPRETLGMHPWSLGGGGAAAFKERLDNCSSRKLGSLVLSIGRVAHTGADGAYVSSRGALQRRGLDPEQIAEFVEGDKLRDWSLSDPVAVAFPYTQDLEQVTDEWAEPVIRYLWPFRSMLWERREPGGTHREIGFTWHQFSRFHPERYHGLGIAFAFVATHNHFVLDRGGKVFKQSAPVIKLPAEATEDDHFALLGLLNSSTACFWMKQVFHCKGSQGINEGMKSSLWEQFFEFDATKLRLFPVPSEASLVTPLARALDDMARYRTTHTASSILAFADGWTDATSLAAAMESRRDEDFMRMEHMVALQEELDWLCYRLYGLDADNEPVTPAEIEGTAPTLLPWTLNRATRDAEIRAAMAAGEDPGEQPSVWFERHRWDPAVEVPATCSRSQRERTAHRRKRISEVKALALIETPEYKRRWYRPDYPTEERLAMESWLAEKVEAVARDRGRSFTLEQAAAALQDDSRVLAVCEVLTGRRDFALAQLVLDVLQGDAVPNHRFHVYKSSGLVKREVWERTWEDQRREDKGVAVEPEVPPTYGTGDFLRNEYWRLRGKLDVPKERFIAFTEVPGRTPAETLYGWAGWTPLQRLRAILAMDADLEDAGVAVADRIGLLDSAWRLLPDAAREDADAVRRLRAELESMVGTEGPSAEMLADWRQRFLPPGSRANRKNGQQAKKTGRRKKS